MKVYGNLLSTMLKVTIDQGDLMKSVITSWNEDLLDVDHLTHDNWVVYFNEAAEVYSPEELRHAEANPACKIHEGRCASHWNSRPKSFARIFLPRWTSSASPNAPKFEDRSQEETEWQELGACEAAWQAGQKCIKIQGSWKSNTLLTFGTWVPACIKSQTWGTRICYGLRCVDAHDKKRTWVKLKWILWRNRAVLRYS